MFSRQAEGQGRGVDPNDLREHRTGVSTGQLPAAVGPFLLGQLLTFIETDRYTIQMHEKAVFSQKFGEQHPVPVFIGNFVKEIAKFLRILLGSASMSYVSELPAMSSKPSPQDSLLPPFDRSLAALRSGLLETPAFVPASAPRHQTWSPGLWVFLLWQ